MSSQCSSTAVAFAVAIILGLHNTKKTHFDICAVIIRKFTYIQYNNTGLVSKR